MVVHPDFRGTIRDIGGATANMWNLGCSESADCDRPSCLAPRICKKLESDQQPYLDLLKKARKVEGVKHLFISSGVRMDLALHCEPFIEAFARHYTSGHAKVAPEHIVPRVLKAMMKPEGGVFLEFLKQFQRASAKAGKKQYVLPYFIAAHPGSRVEDMVEVALFLKREHLRVEQCQIFTPIPGTASAVMYATGINPFDNKPIYVERNVRRREMQKALVLWHSSQSARLVREALEYCGRSNLLKELAAGTAGPQRKPASRDAKERMRRGKRK